MKIAFGILKRDLVALLKNPIALLVVGALLVLPGLYAWYCIFANWDPYSNTGNMPVAVVNHDRGAESSLTGTVNIGEMVTDKLKDNDKIDWHFYDNEEEALEDTKIGVVYATLVMPEDLSEDVIGIFGGSGEKPTIYYYPNEKFNAVATKVTDSAAQTLVRQINQGFSSIVNEKVLNATQSIADKVEAKASETNQSAIAEVNAIRNDLVRIIASLDDASSSIVGWRNAADGASTALAATAEQLPRIRSLLDQGSSQLDDLRVETDGFESQLSSTVLSSAATVSGLSAQAGATLKRAAEDLSVVSERLQALSEAASEDEDLRAVVDALNAVVVVIDDIVIGVDVRVDEMNDRVQEATKSVTDATNEITNEVMPQLDEGSYKLATSFSVLSGAIGQFEPQVANLRAVLAETDSALVTADGAIADAKALLATISTNLRGTITDIGAIGNALEIDRLSQLLNVDPENVGSFISSPVQMVTEKIFPVSNYGTAVAPFYTNLALWVGCFILVSLIKVEVDPAGFEHATPRERYFGRWWLFIICSLLQSQVICGVDILLGIDCGNPALFMLAGAVCSFAYMNLIYALVRTFRNIGKTLCIFLIIMQVPGSSGMYPIQIMPGFFQFIHPVLPFTYGIDAMREALSGIYGSGYLIDLLMLLLIVPVSLLVGLGLRPAMGNLLALFDDEMKKAGFFASEEYREKEADRIRGMVRALAAHGSYADDIEERSWRFNRSYPRLRKAGSILAFVVPLAFLVLMLPLNVFADISTDVKLTALIIMLAVLLIVQIALIVLEYVHRMIDEETKMVGASLLEEFDLASLMSEDAEAVATNEEGPGPAMITELDKVQGKRAVPAKSRRGVARDIFTTDLRLGFQSVIGVVVIVLLVITPSLYAWFNIAASWDPYGATGNLKVAVANDDEGYKGDLVPITINIGDTIVSQLHGNNSFDWVFVGGGEDALEGVRSGAYYAAIEIPADFSRNMMTYIVEDADYPNVTYYTNEKENPIAPLITQKGADAIQENIRVSFSTRVDEVALSVAYDVLNYVTNPKMSSYVAKMSAHLDDATRDTKSAAKELGSLAVLVRTVGGVVETTGATLDGVKAAGESAEAAVGDAKAGVANASAAFERAVAIVKGMLNGRELNVDSIQRIVDTVLTMLEVGSEGVPPRIDDAIVTVKDLRDSHPDVPADKFNAVIKSLKNAKKRAEAVPGKIAQARTDVDGLIASAVSEIAAVKDYFNNTVKSSIDELKTTIEGITSSTSEIVDGLEGAISGIGDSTGGLSSQLTMLSNGLVKADDKLQGAATSIEDTKARVAEALKSGDLKQIEAAILGSDPESMAASLATPLHEQREPMYKVANFGSAMASFYTVLSLWVGALVMISTMRTRVAEERIEELRQRYAKVCPRHEFFGRYGIFGVIGLMQSSLVLLGDLLFLHIQCDNPVLFFLFGLFIGQAFCLIVYTITEMFGDVGKALCVILLIMQVAASGGTFPAEMLDRILFDIVPFLPFYHAMSLLQQCVAGIEWVGAAVSIAALLVMTGAILIVGLPLRRPFRKVNVFLEEQLEKTGYM